MTFWLIGANAAFNSGLLWMALVSLFSVYDSDQYYAEARFGWCIGFCWIAAFSHLALRQALSGEHLRARLTTVFTLPAALILGFIVLLVWDDLSMRF